MHHTIVALERVMQPLPPTFNFPADTTYTLEEHETTPTKALLHARIRHATIIIVTTLKIDAETLSPEISPNLRLVAVMATGTDPVDLDACKKRGIHVTNSPAANLDAVSEHAISLYFAARRRTVRMDALTREVPSPWKMHGSLNGHMRFADGKPPLTCKDEVLGVVGYGGLGKHIETLGRALGMEVLIAGRKGETLAPQGRIPFDDMLRRATVIILCLPRNPQTLNLLSTAEFAQMSPYAVVINVARGGIVDEAAVVHALKKGQIAGYAADVFDHEPVEGEGSTPLLSEEARGLNVTMTPHIAWFSQRTLANLGRILGDTVEAWMRGEPINVVC